MKGATKSEYYASLPDYAAPFCREVDALRARDLGAILLGLTNSVNAVGEGRTAAMKLLAADGIVTERLGEMAARGEISDIRNVIAQIETASGVTR